MEKTASCHTVCLEGPAGVGKTQRLIAHVAELLVHHPSESVLLLCSNYYRKSQFLEQLQTHISGCYAQLQITTFYAFVRNALNLYWPLVEETIDNKGKIGGHPVIFPELSGFEASEYILKRVLYQAKQRNPELFASFEGMDKSVMMQLLRRVRLRAENRLSRQDMKHRSDCIGEADAQDAERMIQAYDRWCFQLRVLDNSKQIDVFHGLLENNPWFAEQFTHRIRHLVVDDVDETIPAQQDFVQLLAPHLDSLVMACDPDGGSRRGYLNAYPEGWERLKALSPKPDCQIFQREDVLHQAAIQLHQNWITNQPALLPVTSEVQWRSQALTHLDMLDDVVVDMVDMIQQQGCKPGDMVLVMPTIDPVSRLYFQKQCRHHGLTLQILTGTHRPTDNPSCQSLLLLLQLVNRIAWQLPLSPIEFHGLLRQGFQLHQLDPEGLEKLVNAYRQGLPQQGMSFLPSAEGLNDKARPHYEKLLQWLTTMADKPMDEQLYSAFSELISPYLTAQDDLTDIQQLIRSLYIQSIAEAFLDGIDQKETLAAREWLLQVKTGVVSDNPNKPNEIDTDAIVLGTPQKVIDLQIRRPYQFWLDVSSREWSRTDNAPLYNAWVHSPLWDGETTEITDAMTQSLARKRAAHVTRTLMLYATHAVYMYSSETDERGQSHHGMLHRMIQLPRQQKASGFERATLRDDQAHVLQYERGPMAITAVPGAGKTFINVELLLELIERGIAPEQLLVLTYMDSAARTLLNRLRGKLRGVVNTLPTVSTIHSLALRIITEGDHGQYLGLDTTRLRIMDESTQRETLQQIQSLMQQGDEHSLSLDTMARGLQRAKSYRLSSEELHQFCKQHKKGLRQLREFIPFYRVYEEQGRQQGKLDFVDLIVLAIELLENHPEIRNKYQQTFQVVIEDEAQDSSHLLQQLLGLLTASHGNLIRTGDTNQSITTTFSTAETSVFRDFIAHCHTHGQVVTMDRSSRSASPIMTLANQFIAWALQDDIVNHAFQAVTLMPVEGHNPDLSEPITFHQVATLMDEQQWLAQTITALKQKHPQYSMAVLLRRRDDVLDMTDYLQQQGIKAISHIDVLHRNAVFLFILNGLKLLENPADMGTQQAFFDDLNALHLMDAPLREESPLWEQSLFSFTPSDIDDATLLQLYFDLHDVMRYAFGRDMCRLLVRFTDLFLKEPQQRSFGYLCALQSQEWVESMTAEQVEQGAPLNFVIEQFERCLKSNQLPFRYSVDTEALPAHLRNQFVHVMTTHKSKGQEFDMVFLPQMTENSYPSDMTQVRMSEGDKLELQLERVRHQLGEADYQELEITKKRSILEEEARLVFVGITRAQRGLFLSVSEETKKWGRKQPAKPSHYFHVLKQCAHTPADTSAKGVTPHA